MHAGMAVSRCISHKTRTYLDCKFYESLWKGRCRTQWSYRRQEVYWKNICRHKHCEQVQHYTGKTTSPQPLIYPLCWRGGLFVYKFRRDFLLSCDTAMTCTCIVYTGTHIGAVALRVIVTEKCVNLLRSPAFKQPMIQTQQ